MQNSIPSLAELNASPTIHHHHFNGYNGIGDVDYTLERRVAVGSQSRRWGSSGKTHLLFTLVVIAADWTNGKVDPRAYRVGSVFSAHTPCDSNGQHTGQVYPNVDTDAVDCSRCQKRLAALS